MVSAISEDILQQQGPKHIRQLERMTITFDNLILVETRSGDLSLKITCDDGSVKTLHSLYDPEGEAKRLVDVFQFDGKGILVVLGLGLGYHVKELVKRFPQADILIVEAIPEIYDLAKGHGKISGLEGKSKFLLGLTPGEAIEEITKHQIKAGMPQIALFTLSSAIAVFPRYYKPILDALKNTVSLRLWDKLRYPKFKEDSLRIAVVESGYFLNLEVERAIKHLGHKVIRVIHNKDEDFGEVLSRTIKTIIEHKPDFILSINHIGFDEDGVLASLLASIELPAASWFVDSPNLIIKPFDKNISSHVSVFLWDRGYIKDMKAVGFESVVYLPLAADEMIFRPMSLTPLDIEKHNSDVGFVGNSMTSKVKERAQKVPEELHPLIGRIAGIISSSRIPFDEVLKTVSGDWLKKIASLSVYERRDFEAATLWQSTLLYRLSCIKQIKGFNHRIHGDEGWMEILNTDYRLGPPLDYYSQLPIFYNACKVNLNATSLQMPEAVNQRVFDVPACGSFLLTDHQEAIEELFEVGKEVVTYRDRDEIPEMVRFYLNNPGARRTVAMKGRERVLREHTYKHRIGKIIEVMRSRYG